MLKQLLPMTSFKCERCGYTTDRRGNLRNHLKRKQFCEPKLCDRSPIALLHDIDNKAHGNCKNNALEETTDLNTLLHIIKEQQKEINELKNLRTTTYNTQNTQNLTINIQGVPLNEYGNESLHHVSDDFMKTCLVMEYKGIVDLIRIIHEVPENRNFKYKSAKKVEIWKDNRWVVVNDASFVGSLLQINRNRLFHVMQNNLDDECVSRNIHGLTNFLQDVADINSYNQNTHLLKKDLKDLTYNLTIKSSII